MKALTFKRYGKSPEIGFSEVPRPALKADEMLVQVHAAGVNPVDNMIPAGIFKAVLKFQLPATLGSDLAGVVVEVGSRVTRFKVGDAVFANIFDQGTGSIAEFAVVPEGTAALKPANLDFVQAASIPMVGLTSWQALKERIGLRAGQKMFIPAGSGGIGTFAIQLAKLLGATVIATGRSQAKLDAVAAEGADHVIAVGDLDSEAGQRDLRDRVRAVTGGRGVDVVHDGVGGPISVASLRCVRFGARYLIVGWAATPGVARGKGGRGAPNANQLPTNLLMMKALTVQGCPTVLATLHDPSLRPPRLDRIMRWVAEGKIVPHVSHVFPLAEFKEAMRAKWRGAARNCQRWSTGACENAAHSGLAAGGAIGSPVAPLAGPGGAGRRFAGLAGVAGRPLRDQPGSGKARA